MSKRELIVVCGFVTIVFALVAQAAVVTPQRGGGTVGGTVAPMIMPEITIVGSSIVVTKPDGSDWVTLTGTARPIMRTLTGTDTLDPAAAWYGPLNGMAWNWQYGWANASLDQALIPNGSKIWIELLEQSPGLKTYDRNASNLYGEIFGTPDLVTGIASDTKWKWYETVSMSHNAYTVTPGYADYSATYKVYIGDATTGAALSGYGYDTVTLTWTSIPEPATMTLMGMGIVYFFGSRRQHRNAA